MDPKIKWIGGATAALVLAIGGATLAGGVFSEEARDVAAETTGSTNPQSEITSEPAVQLVAEAAPEDEPLVIKRILPISGPIKYGEWHWDDAGVPDGPVVMTVDLEARVISVFQGGYEIGAAAVLLGTEDHPTPLGTFPILSKERHNVSEKYNNAPMPWTLRLTWDGVAIHGGSTVENGYASHGCVAAPDGFMDKLYKVAAKGDKVVITRGKRIGMGDPII
ncbi:MAG: L,D-transpeptidase family protein [Allopontixanthobacter sediminis]